METNLDKEADSFDQHVRERMTHGMIPDLRRLRDCDWFYNNVWRRPYLMDLVFGRNLRFALKYCAGHSLLEIGSGPGHMTLEFARAGMEVTGLELSGECIKIARRFATENPFTEGFGSLEYVQGDFMTWKPHRIFDTVCIFGTLHHFRDLAAMLEKVDALLSDNGRLIVVEPIRDDFNTKDALVIALIRQLLSLQNAWYQKLNTPGTPEALLQLCGRLFVRIPRGARQRGKRFSLPTTTATYAGQIFTALRERF